SLSFLLTRRARRAPLFPYTTLFRSAPEPMTRGLPAPKTSIAIIHTPAMTTELATRESGTSWETPRKEKRSRITIASTHAIARTARSAARREARTNLSSRRARCEGGDGIRDASARRLPRAGDWIEPTFTACCSTASTSQNLEPVDGARHRGATCASWGFPFGAHERQDVHFVRPCKGLYTHYVRFVKFWWREAVRRPPPAQHDAPIPGGVGASVEVRAPARRLRRSRSPRRPQRPVRHHRRHDHQHGPDAAGQ